MKDIISSEFNNIKVSVDETNVSVNNISNIFLHKNSSTKGKISENVLETLLCKKFPNKIIERVSKETASGDIIIKTENRPDIMIENKDYSLNVPKNEIDKFIRDTTDKNMCGILISQQSGISTKHNFEIEIVENRILLYIFECQYNMETIETALSIIYSLYSFISVNTNSDKNNIDEITFENIQKEYMEFIKNRNEIINSLNLSIKNLRKMDLQNIKTIIDKNNNKLPITSDSFPCSECDRVFASVQSLSAHKKVHVRKLREPQTNNESSDS